MAMGRGIEVAKAWCFAAVFISVSFCGRSRYGAAMGTLRVVVHIGGQRKVLWELSGDQGHLSACVPGSVGTAFRWSCFNGRGSEEMCHSKTHFMRFVATMSS